MKDENGAGEKAVTEDKGERAEKNWLWHMGGKGAFVKSFRNTHSYVSKF